MKENRSKASRTPMMAGKKIIRLSTLSLSMLCITTAYAAETEDSTTTAEPKAKVVKVAVTGSSIKGVAAQSSSPITVVKVEELQRQGITSVEEAMSKISANQSSFVTSMNVGASGTAGSTADLRALGANKTLILLNGRRVAANANDSGVTNLNIIPLAMLDRIEILRDGASAIYGTDAISGVINFITKKQYTGLSLTSGYQQPEQEGGEKQFYTIFGGFGDLDEQGYNIYGAVDYRKGEGVMASERDISKRGGILPELGVNRDSSGAFPSNYNYLYQYKTPSLDPKTGAVIKNSDGSIKYDSAVGGVSGNPYASTGCSTNSLYYPNSSGKICRFNSQASIGIIPESEDVSVLGKLTAKLTDNLNLFGEYVYAKSEITTVVAPDVFFDLTMNKNSKYFPGNGITPALAPIPPMADGDILTSGLPSEIGLYTRSQGGNRVSLKTDSSHRFLIGLEGEAFGWDINGGVNYALSSTADSLVSGYMNFDGLQNSINAGLLNPFGQPVAGDPNLWSDLSVTGTYSKADLKATTIDFSASRPIFTLPAGDVGFAVGASYRRDDWTSTTIAEIAALAPSTGVDPTQPQNRGKREIKAAFTELQIPIFKSLEAQLAARYDEYSDFGDTFNPKFALRWEPIKQLMLRGTYSTGFRAPTLWEVNGPNYVTNTAATYDDPVLCPGGKVNTAGGGLETRDCGMQFDRQNGGNKDLDAEESKSFTLGAVFEPIKSLVFTLDYYNIKVENQISTMSESSIFADPAKYAANYVRKNDGSLNYIITTNQNLGNVETSGYDVSATWLSPTTAYGRFGLNIDGTYVDQYKYQNEKDGDWVHNVGNYGESGPVLRWKHTANINWNLGNWSANLQQDYKRGYLDQNSDGQNHQVDDYTQYNLSGTWKGFKNLELTMGVKNLLDEDPTASNVLDNFQMGYDPRYSTDPYGRTYFVRGTYKFF